MTKLPAYLAVATVLDLLKGRPGVLVGSAVAAEEYNLPFEYSDVDVFLPSAHALASTTQFMLDNGAVMDESECRTWARWERSGVGDWKTNSIKVETLEGIEVNLVYKTIDRAPVATLEAVIGSFDFGYVAMGYTLKTSLFHDARSFFFPSVKNFNQLGLMPDREAQWMNANVGKYNGIRQAQRFAKFANRGFDMSLIAPPLIKGYRGTALHYSKQDDPELLAYSEAYYLLADYIEADNIQGLLDGYSELKLYDPAFTLKTALTLQADPYKVP